MIQADLSESIMVIRAKRKKKKIGFISATTCSFWEIPVLFLQLEMHC